MQRFVLKPQDSSRFDHLYDGELEAQMKPDTLAVGMVDDESVPPRAAGLLLAQVRGSSLVVNWLYVIEPCRRKRVATELMDGLLAAATREEALESVEVFLSEGQKDLQAFFEYFGFGILFQEGWGEFQGTLGDIAALPKKTVSDYNVVPLYKASTVDLRKFSSEIVTHNISCGVPLPIKPEEYDPASMVCYHEDEIVAVGLVCVDQEGVKLPWLYAESHCGKALIPLLSKMVKTVQNELPPETPLVIGTMGRAGERLAEHLLPDVQWREVYVAAWQL